MRQHRIFPKAAVFLGALGLATATISAAPAQSQYECPYGYYYVLNYGCAPLAYYSNPTILMPGFGLFYGGRGGYHAGGHRGDYHGGGHRGGGHGGGGGHRR